MGTRHIYWILTSPSFAVHSNTQRRISSSVYGWEAYAVVEEMYNVSKLYSIRLHGEIWFTVSYHCLSNLSCYKFSGREVSKTRALPLNDFAHGWQGGMNPAKVEVENGSYILR